MRPSTSQAGKVMGTDRIATGASAWSQKAAPDHRRDVTKSRPSSNDPEWPAPHSRL